MVSNLGAHEALLMENHGALVCGATVGAAYYTLHLLCTAAERQLAAMAAAGGDASRVALVSPKVVAQTAERLAAYEARTANAGGAGWGEREWAAAVRALP